ncbi:mannitol dehydrogenase [Actinoplanes sp. OR16]|uniref:mannitol dehydrogenase family protein n=1 Tax=Actinoplanes sp. OR16 TaxID=946334 RepID=UPI000F6BCF6B|nr:mannitol dehydrogenase family protein [Actinoplanes sp. OR16]BBH71371.1 mannitol dehydrogenase [Actinoplanes sp. OR16]
MKLGLSSQNALPIASRPLVRPGEVRPGIVHLGLGAFHRAHQAVYTESAVAASGGNWGIVGVAPRSREIVDRLREQDQLYSVLTVGSGERDHVRAVGILAGLAHAAGDPYGVVAAVADPGIRIVSLTVTEKAYQPPADLSAQVTGKAPPVSVPALLARGILARHGAPLTVLCCDNLQGNGPRVRSLVAETLEHAGAELPDTVAFPSTMVDRIVPATSADHRRRAALALGADDAVPVAAEPFTQWVIEDRFPGGRPDWAAAGAILTTDVTPWETLKLRALNAVHSALAYLGALAGRELIADALELPGMTGVLRRFLADEVTPAVTPPPGTTVTGYGATVLTRFANRELGHRTLQVAMDGTQKLPHRLLGTVQDLRDQGGTPCWAGLFLAAWMRFARGYADSGAPLPLDDPMASRIRESLSAVPDTPNGVTSALLGLTEVFPPSLAGDDVLRREVVRWYSSLDRHGAEATIREAGA